MANEIEEVSFQRRPPKETAIFIWANATTFSKIVGVIVLLLAVSSLLQSWYFRSQDDRVLACQADFMEQVVDSIQVRADANASTSEAVDEILFRVNDALETRDFTSLDEALDEYEEQRRAAIEQKANAELPDISVSQECARG